MSLKNKLLGMYNSQFKKYTSPKEYITLETSNSANEEEFEIYGNRLANWLIDRLKIYHTANQLAKGEALELGCGIDRLVKPASMSFKSLAGVDFSSKMLDEAKLYLRDIKNISLYENNGQDLNIFSDNSFNYVYSSGVI